MSTKVFNNLARGAGIAAVLAMSPMAAQATTIKVAAAANYTVPLTQIISEFESDYAAQDYHVTVNFDSSGALEKEINGTCTGCSGLNPHHYDLFLAADTDHVQNLINFPGGGLVYPYATGKDMFVPVQGTLVLWSNTAGVNVSGGLTTGWDTKCLNPNKDDCVAIADPPAAPYGKAAQQVLLNAYGITALSDNRIKTYSNITNTFNAVDSGSQPYGFVAKSQVCTACNTSPVWSGVSHQVITSGYDDILQGGAELVNSLRTTPTSDEQAELDTFIQYLAGRDFSNSPVTPNATATLGYYGYSVLASPF